jgi:hypothetical protein
MRHPELAKDLARSGYETGRGALRFAQDPSRLKSFGMTPVMGGLF